MNKVKILTIVFSLALGALLIIGGIEKFKTPTPAPNSLIEKIKKGEVTTTDTATLKMENYIFGMQQTGYFWPFLGIVELLAGILLVSQFGAKIGAIIALPITINILLFHIFLEPNELDDLIVMILMVVINLVLIGFTYRIWKPLLYDKTVFNLKNTQLESPQV